jgi:putative ABC transport system permease protein
MLKFLPLLLTTLRRKPLRSVLTILSVGVTFLLFGILESFRYGITTIVAGMNDNRLITIPAGNQPLPLGLLGSIQRTPGVIAAMGTFYVPIVLPPGRTARGALAVGPEEVLEVYPEIKLDDDERQQWLTQRTAAIVSEKLARRQGWKRGDTVSLAGSTFVKRDGSRNWEVTIAGVFPPGISGFGELYFHRDYFNESVAFGGNIMTFVISRVSGPAAGDRVREAIDAGTANSAAPSKTTSLNVYMRRGAAQLGNVSALVLSVIAVSFFTMLLVTASTMGQSVRERAGEFAVMKTLGFTDLAITALVLSEALLICLTGALLALGVMVLMSSTSTQQDQNILPLTLNHLLVSGAALIAGCTLAASLLPLQQIWRESIVEGLRHE